MNNDTKKVQPFDSFSAVYKILVWAGYYKPLNYQSSPLKRAANQIYRLLVLLFIAVYNVQHLIFIVQHCHDMAKLMDCLVIEIPQMNLFVKVFTMNVQTSRIDKINELLKGPIFTSTDYQGQLILQRNTVAMHRLSKAINFGVCMAAFFWPASFFVKRYTDPNEVVNSYMPFETDTWAKFSLSVFFEAGPILWIGFGHISLDCLIATFYAQAQTQLKLIKHQLRQLVPTKDKVCENQSIMESHFVYKDFTDETILKRFIKIVKRYEKVIWYKNEVDTVFNVPLSVQFLSTGSTVCLVIYRMTNLSVASFSFLFLVVLFLLLLTQVFMYCFYGNLVEFESQTINDSLYHSDWVSLSPSFRRLLLIAMIRWSQPIRPIVSKIIPISLTTFISILKSSYTLYTVLVVTAN